MKIAVLAEQNFNMIDGSTIWLLNTCKLLAMQPDFETVLILSHDLTNRALANELPGPVRMIDPTALGAGTGSGEAALTADALVGSLTAFENAEGRFDRIFVRGTSYMERLLNAPQFRSRLIGYAPNVIPDLSVPEPEWVKQGRSARMPMVVQSTPAKRALETLSHYPANIVHVVPPIGFPATRPPRDPGQPTTLCYSGKIDPQYGMDWLIDFCEAPPEDTIISLIAAKDTYRSRHRDFFARMDAFRARIASGDLPHIRLATSLGHAAAKTEMARADFSWCLRHPYYDDVIEISTKIVEFCTLGVPPILNDNAPNRELFGEDYPYFVDIAKGNPGADLRKILASRNTPDHALACARAETIAAQFSPDLLSDKLGRAIRGWAYSVPALTDRPRHLLIATHDPKFLRQFTDRLKSDPRVKTDWQLWASIAKPGTPLVVPDDVETVFCEWCCENAVWHSKNKRPDTKLIVRLHRFEITTDFPAQVNWGAVDALIVVSDYIRDLMVRDHGVDPARIHVWPQFIDWHELQRDKLPEARFTLGLVGINPLELKRFDRALDFLTDLRRVDPRFTLAVRSVMPWKIEWIWNNRPEVREKAQALFDRIYSDPLLQDAVRFDPPGPDMEEWYRGVGVILSSSDVEGCHTAVMEGMASGCHPVVHDWPGARSLFSPHVFADMRDAIPELIRFADLPDQSPVKAGYARAMAIHDVGNFTRNFMAL